MGDSNTKMLVPLDVDFTPVVVVAVYVGCATVGAAAWWFMVYEHGPKLNYYQLVCIACLQDNTVVSR